MTTSGSSLSQSKSEKQKKHVSLGQHGENVAAQHLIRQGYEILQRNWRAGRAGEIDLIARKPDKALLLFVEVKTRSTEAYGQPVESVTASKQAQLIRVAEHYLQAHPHEGDIRFDVIGVSYDGRSPDPAIEVYENAFDGG